jgi:hypothetical protein
MIDVNELYNITNDLIRKDHAGGYTSGPEFNRLLKLAQETLYRFYYDNKDEAQARQSLVAFQTSITIPSTSSGYAKPGNYKDKLDARLLVGSVVIPVHFPARDELAMSLSSAIRGPSIERKVIVGESRPGYFYVWPETSYKLLLRYYKEPPVPERVTEIDEVTTAEVYDEAGSTQLDWDYNNLQDFIDLLLFYKGVSIRDSSLLQWVQAKDGLMVNKNMTL